MDIWPEFSAWMVSENVIGYWLLVISGRFNLEGLLVNCKIVYLILSPFLPLDSIYSELLY